MKRVLAINGSPRLGSNSSILLDQFIEGVKDEGGYVTSFWINDLHVKPCSGCLRCNLIKRCSIRDDDWEDLSSMLKEADVIVFAMPVYFHHVPAPVKLVLDRFRSFVHVQITENGLIHTPHESWSKDFVLLLSMGSPDTKEADPIVDLFSFVKKSMGEQNRLHTIRATRLAVSKQVSKSREELRVLYRKMNLSEDLVEADYAKNQEVLAQCHDMGKMLAAGNS